MIYNYNVSQFEYRLAQIEEYYHEGRINADRRKELIFDARKWLRLAEDGFWDEQASRQEARDGCA